jgi:hypothetical protein
MTRRLRFDVDGPRSSATCSGPPRRYENPPDKIADLRAARAVLAAHPAVDGRDRSG